MRAYSDIIIIGAGASGLMCSALLAEKDLTGPDGKPAAVTVLEKNSRVGRKLSATGNGRCNFTNLHMSADCYYSDPEWMGEVLKHVPVQRVLDRFAGWGVFHRQRDGYVYPHTNQAAAVIRALTRAADRENVEFATGCYVKKIRRKNRGFEVITDAGVIGSRILAIAMGSAAGRESGGDASGYGYMRDLGLVVEDPVPALTGLVCGGSCWKRAAGTRIQGSFSLLVDDRKAGEEIGEIQIVKDGVSGIPVFQLCRVAAKALAQKRKVAGAIDFVPSLSAAEVDEWVGKHGVFGLVPDKWEGILAKKGAACLKQFSFTVTDTFGMDRAQAAAGGVSLSGADPGTMESKGIPNLFLLGEILDVDGRCGGYNLHFAWASAMLAAEAIAARIRD